MTKEVQCQLKMDEVVCGQSVKNVTRVRPTAESRLTAAPVPDVVFLSASGPKHVVSGILSWSQLYKG